MLPSNPKTKRLTGGEWDKRSSVVYEIRLLNGTGREFYRPLSNQPPFGPELIRERAEVPWVPMQREGVDRHARSLWEVTNARQSASNV
jgi:hypothetical protein